MAGCDLEAEVDSAWTWAFRLGPGHEVSLDMSDDSKMQDARSDGRRTDGLGCKGVVFKGKDVEDGSV